MKQKLILALLLIILIGTGCTEEKKDLFVEGKAAFDQGDFQQATVLFDELITNSPERFEGYLYKGFIHLYHDQPQQAIAFFEDSLSHNPAPNLEYLGLGQAYMVLEEYEKARDYLEKVRNLENYPVTDYLLGFIYLDAGDQRAAREVLNTASESYPERGEIWAALGKISLENLQVLDAVQAYQMAYVHGIKTYDLYAGLAEAYYQLGNFHQAISIAEQALAEDHITDAEKEEIRLKIAQYNINQNPSRAIKSLEGILQTDPTKPEVLLMLGQLYYQQKKYEKTIEYYGRYLDHYRPLAQVLYLMYQSHLTLGNTRLAEKYLLDAIDLEPKKLSYRYYLIQLYQEMEKWEEAVSAYQQALELRPDDLEMLSNLSSILMNLERYEEAITYLSRAIELAPDHVDYYLLKAQAYFKLGNSEAEVHTYEEILELDPRNIIALNNLAQLCQATNKLDRAYQLYQKAIEIKPKEDRYFKHLGYIKLIQKDYEKARNWLEQAVQLNDQDFESYRFLGDTYFAEDQYQEAVKNYKKSLEINSDYHETRYPLGKAYFYLNKLDLAQKQFQTYQKNYPNNEGTKFYLERITWLKNQDVPDIDIVPATENEE